MVEDVLLLCADRDATHSTAGGIGIVAAIVVIGGVSCTLMPQYQKTNAEVVVAALPEPSATRA